MSPYCGPSVYKPPHMISSFLGPLNSGQNLGDRKKLQENLTVLERLYLQPFYIFLHIYI